MRIERKKKRELKLPEGRKIGVGLPSGAVSDETLAKAIYNHFGTADIPARPFITNALRDNRLKYRRMMADMAGPILRGELTSDDAMARLAEIAVADVKAEMVKAKPHNAADTVRKKGSDNPLIEGGAMQRGITWRRDP